MDQNGTNPCLKSLTLISCLVRVSPSKGAHRNTNRVGFSFSVFSWSIGGCHRFAHLFSKLRSFLVPSAVAKGKSRSILQVFIFSHVSLYGRVHVFSAFFICSFCFAICSCMEEPNSNSCWRIVSLKFPSHQAQAPYGVPTGTRRGLVTDWSEKGWVPSKFWI